MTRDGSIQQTTSIWYISPIQSKTRIYNTIYLYIYIDLARSVCCVSVRFCVLSFPSPFRYNRIELLIFFFLLFFFERQWWWWCRSLLRSLIAFTLVLLSLLFSLFCLSVFLCVCTSISLLSFLIIMFLCHIYCLIFFFFFLYSRSNM